jgi:outer membrane protein TolC
MHAQDTITLKRALDIALKNNLGVQVQKNNINIAHINNSYGMAGGLPLVNATANDVEQTVNIKQKYSDAANDKLANGVSSNNLSGALNASMLISNGYRVVTAKKRLNVQEEQSKRVLTSREQIVAINVMLKYYDIIRQQSYAKTLQQSIDVSKQKLDIVKTQQSVGMANNADLFQAQVDLNTQVQTLQQQQLVVDQDKTDLLTLLTLNPDSTVSIVDTILIDTTIELKTILNNITSHPDVIVAEEQVQVNKYIQRETAAQRYPSLSVNTAYTLGRTQSAAGFTLLNQTYGPAIGLGLTVPIFNGGIYKRQQQVAGINIQNAQLLHDTIVNNYTANAVKNWQAYQSNLEQLKKAQENYDLSQKLLDLIIQRFQLRQSTIVDVKNAQQSFENAGYLLINLSYAAKSSEIQLKRYANQLSY